MRHCKESGKIGFFGLLPLTAAHGTGKGCTFYKNSCKSFKSQPFSAKFLLHLLHIDNCMCAGSIPAQTSDVLEIFGCFSGVATCKMKLFLIISISQKVTF